MTYNIPIVGDKIMLTAPWTFDVKRFYKNSTLISTLVDNAHNITYVWRDENKTLCKCTLPYGTILQVDLLRFVRYNNENYLNNYVVFRVLSKDRSWYVNTTVRPKRVRFAVTHTDAMNIMFKKVTE